MIQCTSCWAKDAQDYDTKLCADCAVMWEYEKRTGQLPAHGMHPDELEAYEPPDEEPYGWGNPGANALRKR